MPPVSQYASGWPGIAPQWTSSDKSGVGTSLHTSSRVWFTLSHGILNEVYYPRVDQACIRDLGLIVTGRDDFFSEEKRDTESRIRFIESGVPAYQLVNTCRRRRYRIEKEILTDPQRDVVLQFARFVPLEGSLSDYRVYALLAPHLGNCGWGNTAWVGDYKGMPMLFAERNEMALAAACSPGWACGSAGFVGVSDGWQDLVQHKRLLARNGRAENGNVALTGEVNLATDAGTFVIALAFGRCAAEAGYRARASLLEGFERARTMYVGEWRNWQRKLAVARNERSDACDLARTSAAVLRCHEEKRLPGGIIASLSIPWGNSKSDEDLGGYHLTWPRDLVQTAGGLLAAGAYQDAPYVLGYLRVTQEANGGWPQNMWTDGQPYWSGIQLDATALPILLVDLLRLEHCADAATIRSFWPMVRLAAGFLVRNGPVTGQDRWEEVSGLSPFTLAADIASLLVAADLAAAHGEPGLALYLRETADAWNDGIEQWTYVTGTELALQVGVEGYYVRVGSPQTAYLGAPTPGSEPLPAAHIVSPDALALVRFGLRAADDPRIRNTVKVIDAILKVETPFGPAWHRYNGDRYGEHADGRPFDGSGIGRAWPLLTGERAHYELAAGHIDEATRLLRAVEAFTNEGGLLPEQVWDAPDIPERELFFGRASGSAMPLVWAHAEYLKLRRSLQDGRVYDLPRQSHQRYVIERTPSRLAFWRFDHQIRTMPEGRILRLETLKPSMAHWSTTGWGTTQDTYSRDTGLGIYVIDLPTESLPAGRRVDFTFYWPDDDRWEHADFSALIEPLSKTLRLPARSKGVGSESRCSALELVAK